jgi:ATP-dependent Clp protease ATP-binding subunit ClpA
MEEFTSPGLGNTLKPYLTRPDFRVIGATTNAEFAKMKDGALLRRFYKIDVGEPDDTAIKAIIKSCLSRYGKGLKIENAVQDRILKLSQTMDGFNPDKAKDLTDFLCSYTKLKNKKTIAVSDLDKFFDEYMMMRREKEKEPVAFVDQI